MQAKKLCVLTQVLRKSRTPASVHLEWVLCRTVRATLKIRPVVSVCSRIEPNIKTLAMFCG